MLADRGIRNLLANAGTDFARQSIEPTPGTPEAFRALLATDWKCWKDIVAKTGFKAN